MTSKAILDFAREIHALAVEKGWWRDLRPAEDTFVMIHFELADAVIRLLDAAIQYGDYGDLKPAKSNEAFETFGCFIERCHEDVVCAKCGKQMFEAVGLFNDGYAALIGRIEAWFEANGMDLWRVCRMKHEYNKTRPYRHGNKRM